MRRGTLQGTLIASAVASLFAAHTHADKATKKEPGKELKCAGINECKGTGACAGVDNTCKGKNECKGKGWTKVKSDKDCASKGGTVVAPR